MTEAAVPPGDGRLRPPGTPPARGFLVPRPKPPARLWRGKRHFKSLCETRQTARLGKGRAKGTGGRAAPHPPRLGSARPPWRRPGCPARWPRPSPNQAPPSTQPGTAPHLARPRPGWPRGWAQARWQLAGGVGRLLAVLARAAARGSAMLCGISLLSGCPAILAARLRWVGLGRGGAGGRRGPLPGANPSPLPVHPCVPVTGRPDARQRHGGREEDGEWQRAASGSRGGGPASASGGRGAGAERTPAWVWAGDRAWRGGPWAPPEAPVAALGARAVPSLRRLPAAPCGRFLPPPPPPRFSVPGSRLRALPGCLRGSWARWRKGEPVLSS